MATLLVTAQVDRHNHECNIKQELDSQPFLFRLPGLLRFVAVHGLGQPSAVRSDSETDLLNVTYAPPDLVFSYKGLAARC